MKPAALIIIFATLLAAAGLCAQPVVSNVQASQIEGTKQLRVTYDLEASGTVSVTIRVSGDGGATWTVPATSLTGNGIGSLVNAGTGREILWNAGADWNHQMTNNLRVEITSTSTPASTRVIALSGDLSFGSVQVGQSALRTLTIQNTGNSTLTVSSLSYPSGFSGNWSGGTIAAGATRNVTVTFTPTAAQSYSGNVTVNSDATSGTNTRALSGTGTEDNLMPAEMVLVQGGTLSSSNELNGTNIDSFLIGRYEVTWGEWKEVRTWAAGNGYDIGSRGDGCADDHPVQSVNWYDVLKWSNAKSEQEGLTPVYTVSGSVYRIGEPDHTTISQNLSANGYRLPQEAEWEFAARGGNQTNGYTYSGSNDLNAVGWYSDNSGGAACNLSSGRGTWPVGQKAANELGLYDMSGNVWEWCWDQDRSWRRLRGGSWGSPANGGTVSFRYLNLPDVPGSGDGFRMARSSGS